MSQIKIPVRRIAKAGLFLLDALMITAAIHAATYLRFGIVNTPAGLFSPPWGGITYPEIFPVVIVTLLASFVLGNLYSRESLMLGGSAATRVAGATTYGLLFVIFASFVIATPGISRPWLFLVWVFVILFVTGGRLASRKLHQWLRRRGVLVAPALVIGDNDEAQGLYARMLKREEELTPVGLVSTGENGERGGGRTMGSLCDLEDLIDASRAEAVVAASSALSHDEMTDVLRRVRSLPIGVHISSGLGEIVTSRVTVREIGGAPMTTVRPIGLGWADRAAKRIFDLCVSSVSLFLLSPILLVIALATKLSSPGPVLFRQDRVGGGGATFVMYKFRTMRHGADHSLHRDVIASQVAEDDGGAAMEPCVDTTAPQKIADDPRVTGLGRWLRKFSLDELPQLINVIKGEMSLVGPRPPIPYEVDMYEPWMMSRFEVPPGITGLWQVSGRGDLAYREMVKLDLFYVHNWSLRLDIEVLLKTLPAVLLTKGAY